MAQTLRDSMERDGHSGGSARISTQIFMAQTLRDSMERDGHSGGSARINPRDGHSGGSARINPLFSTPDFQQKVEPGEKRRQNSIAFRDRLGLADFLSLKVWQASLSELLGTAMLVFMIDTIIISSNETDTKAPKLIISVFVSITIAILVLATVPVSGGHINPTVTLTAAFIGIISFSRATIYILAQCVGAVIGALALKAVISGKIEHTFSLGGCTLTIVGPGPDGPIITGLDTAQAIGLEIFCSFSFLFASRWIAFDQRQAKVVGRVIVCSVIGIAAGLNVFISTTVTNVKGYSGAGMNPARCLGPAIVRGGHLWNGQWVFWVGPFIATTTFYLYTKLIPNQHFEPEESKHDLYGILKALLVLDDSDGHSKTLDQVDNLE